MDQLGEKEAEHSSQESSLDHRRKRKDDAAAVRPEGVHGEPTDQRDEAEATGVIKEQVEVVEEAACAGCLVGLHGYCSDDDDEIFAAVTESSTQEGEGGGDDDIVAAAVTESSPQEGEGRGDDDDDKAAGSEVVATQVLLAPRPPAPGPPKEGSGGHGGSHN